MSWNLEGKRIRGLYMGMFPYSGLVVESRVKYGGEVQHTVVVDKPFTVYGLVRDRVLASSSDIKRIIYDEIQAI